MKQLLRKVSYQRFLKIVSINVHVWCLLLMLMQNLILINNDTAVNNRGRKRKHR